MDPAIPRLEALLRTMRHTGSGLLNEDMWEQWASRGASDEERAEHAAAVAALTAERAEAADRLAELVAELRASSPGSVEAWAEAHRAVLDAFIAEHEGDEAQSTSVYVAREEKAGWTRVGGGSEPYVDENTFYVSINPERYRSAFGIEP